MLLRFEELKQSGGLCSSVSTGIAILRATKSAACDLEILSRIAERDPASALRLLQAANQARSYGADRIVSVQAAAQELGVARCREEMLRFSLTSPNRPGYCAAFDYEAFWLWSSACAHAARVLAGHVAALDPDSAYLLGLVSHAGELALATAHPERYAVLLEGAGSSVRSELCVAEREIFQITRWEIAAWLIAEAGLPAEFRHAMLERVQPDHAPASPLERALSSVLKCAELMADVIAGPRRIGRVVEDPWRGIVRHGANMALSEARLRGVLESARLAWSNSTAGAQEDMGEGLFMSPELSLLLATPPSRRPTALVADGDPANRQLIADVLREAGYEVHCAADGLEALKVLEKTHPEIVILDSETPRVGGVAVCEELRRLEIGLRAYVVMLADSDKEEEHIEAFRSGADDCITKPISKRLLLARVQAGRRLVDLHKQVENDKQERLRQISELSLLTRRLEASSTVDDLTGLPNRRYAMSRLEEEWRAAERLGAPLSVIMVDIDHFKRINDCRGHGEGDAVLQEIGMLMLSKIRRADVICRMGGEEFLVINVDSDQVGALQCAERLRTTVEHRAIPGTEPGSVVTISLGVATRSPGMRDCKELLKAADEALYAAKDAGRNTVRGNQPAT